MATNPNNDAAINIGVSADDSQLVKLNKSMDSTQKVSKSMRDTLAVLATAADKTGLSFSKTATVISKEVTKSIQDETKALRQSIITLQDKDNMLKKVIYTEQRLIALRDKSSGTTTYYPGTPANLKSLQEQYKASPAGLSRPKYTYAPYMDGGLQVTQTPFLSGVSKVAQLNYNASAVNQQMMQYRLSAMLGSMAMNDDAVAAARPRGYDRSLTQQRWNTRNALSADAWRRTNMGGETVSSRNYTSGVIGYASGSASRLIPPEFSNGKFKAAFVESKDAAAGFAAEFGKINFQALAARALVVIPTWFVLRNALMAVGSIIPNTVARFRELDQAVADMATQTSGIKSMAEFANNAKTAIQDLAQQTGASVGEISTAYRMFSETGASVEISMAGMNTAIKGSIGTMTDSADLARTLIDLYRMFPDSIAYGSNAAEKMEYVMGILNKLFKENSGKLSEYMESIKNFSGVASGWGLSMKQMLALLTTLHNYAQRGGMSGTQLSRTFQEMTKNSKEMSRYLGKELRGADIDKFATFMAILKKLKDEQSKGINIDTNVMEMFGERSQKAVLALVTGYDTLQKNIAITADETFSLGDALKINEEQFQTRMNTINQQLKRTAAIAGDLSIAFGAALLGIKDNDPVEALKKINDELLKMIKGAREFGKLIHDVLSSKEFQLIAGAAGIGMMGKNVAAFGAANAARAAAIGATGVAATSMATIAPIVGTTLAFLATGAAIGGLIVLATEVVTRILSGKGMGDWVYKLAGGEKADKMKAEDDKLDPETRTRMMLIQRGMNPQEAYQKSHQHFADLGKITITKSAKDMDEKGVEDASNTLLETRMANLERLKIYGWNDIQIQKQKIELLKGQKGEEEAKLQLLKMQNDEAIAYAETIKGSLSGSFENMLSGKGSLKDVFSNLGNTMMDNTRKTLADGMSNMVMATGLGDAFGGIMSTMKNSMASMTERITYAHEDGGKKVYDFIVKGFQDATQNAQSASGQGSSAIAGYGGSNGIGAGANGLLQTGWFAQPMSGKAAVAGQGGYGANTPAGTANMGNYSRLKAPTNGAAMSNLGGVALVGLSTYQGQRNAGAGKAGSALTALGSMGVMAGMMGAFGTAGIGGMSLLAGLGPVGWIAAIGLLVAGMFMSSKSKSVSQQSQTTENRVSSKIDVTNKNLEVINRNLVDLKTAVTTYILPTSVYFSEKRNVEDQWSLSMRRGLSTV
jgi:TP901 family phage tail tape measure protein